ncbi:MAG TPA: hypothetical protein VFS08_16915 [Gemmatimonadaceae bacterium]|nr:hypothetical protein [Gemmatimonadaceae bacterium]
MSPVAERAPDEPDAPRDDAALVAALRREERAALVELYTRFTPLLVRCARAWGAAPADRDELAAEVLGDVALTLMRHTTPVPRSLAAYLVTALRHRMGAAARAAARIRPPASSPDRGARRGGRATADPRAHDGRHHDPRHVGSDVARDAEDAFCSEHSRRAAAPDPAAEATRPALARLAAHLDAQLDEDERLLLAWLAHHVPLRVAAGWLGLPYDTVAKRAQRLRARLRAAAARYVATLPDAERREVQRVLRRGASGVPSATATRESER